MILLFSGTPGSGKSLHAARVIYYTLFRKKPVICNFEINRQYVRNSELFHYLPNEQLLPSYLMQFSRDYFKSRPLREREITVFIDEAQMMFNARSWDAKDRSEWNKFFQVHRHYGYDIILVAQFDRMIDRQIRSLIEYEYIHRKVSNMGWRGKLLCLTRMTMNLFVAVKVWYPMKEHIDREFFRVSKRYFRLYDTYMTFDSPDEQKSQDGKEGRTTGADGGKGVPICDSRPARI